MTGPHSLGEWGESEGVLRGGIARVVWQAKDVGIAFNGSDGSFKMLTWQIVDAALDEGFDECLGYGNNDVVGRGAGDFAVVSD